MGLMGWSTSWAHNLFVMWVLDFLLWAVLNLETQQLDLILQTSLLSLVLLSLSLQPSVPFNPFFHHPLFLILIFYL